MLPEYTKPGYGISSDIEKAVYMQIYSALSLVRNSMDIDFDTSRFSVDITSVIDRVLYDNPSFFFVNSSYYRVSARPGGYKLSFDFLYDEDDIREIECILMKVLTAFKEKYVRDGMSDFEKELAIHNYLVTTVTYDRDSCDLEDGSSRSRRGIYNCLAALLQGRAVCSGISAAFKLLCDYLHLKCLVVIGTTDSVSDSRHAWNMVVLDGATYHVDATWDIKNKGSIGCNFDYFNLSDEMMGLDHDWDRGLYPKCCNEKYNYFRINQLLIDDKEEIPAFVAGKIRSGNKHIFFRMTKDLPPDSEIVSLIGKGRTLALSRESYVYSIARKKRTVYISFD